MEEKIEELVERINYNNAEYILVNEAVVNNKKVYHFLNVELVDFLTDDEKINSVNEKNFPNFNLFCTNDGSNFNVINNKKEINYLLDYFNMVPTNIIMSLLPETIKMGIFLGSGIAYKKLKYRATRIKGEERDKFIENQKENFRKVKDEIFQDLDLERVNKDLEKIKINEVKRMPKNVGAFYDPWNNSVNFNKNTLNGDTNIDKRTMLHETVHYLAGRKYGIANMVSKFFMEGATENIVEDLYNTNKLKRVYLFEKPPYIKDGIEAAKISSDLDLECSYTGYVPLIKQLEYITGMKSYDSAVNGNSKFIKAVNDEIGVIPTILLSATSNPMLKSIGVIKQQERLQNMILRTSFDKKFKNINSVESAKEYLNKLKGFEKYRSQITYLKSNGDIEEDGYFKKYYEEKLEKIIEKYPENSEDFEENAYVELENEDNKEGKRIKNGFKKVARANIRNYLVKQCKGDIDKFPRDISISYYENDTNLVIYKINDEAIYTKNYSNFDDAMKMKSLEIKNPDMSFRNIIKLYFEGGNVENKTETVNFTEEEIKKVCEYYKKIEEMRQKISALKTVTFLDKIKNKIHSMFNKDKKDSSIGETTESVNNIPSEDKKTEYKSWDLRNWKEKQLENVQGKQEVIAEKSQNKIGTYDKKNLEGEEKE